MTALRTFARSVDGHLRLRYASLGDGPPIVLLHGFTDGLESWVELGYTKRLCAAGRRPVLVDQRGHGGSGRPRDPAAYDDALRAGDVIALLDALDIARADILGYSMGGWAALNVARFHPERIDRLIVGGSHPFGQSLAPLRAAVASDIEDWIGAVERLGGPMAEARKERVRANSLAVLQACVATDRPDISETLAGFDRPCLFYAGSEDPLRDSVARCAEPISPARFIELPGCNHVTALTRAERVLPRLLAFLSEAEAPPPAART